MKKALMLVVVIFLVGIFLGLNNNLKAPTQDIDSVISYKIGAALALTGDAAAWGEASKNAILLAQEEINAKGGVNGKNLEIVVEDIKSSSKDSVSAVSKLINIDKVNAVMITWLDSYQGSESVVPKNIPLISQDAAIESVNLPKTNSNVFSMWYRTSAKAKVTVDEMLKSDVKTLYLVTQNDSYYATLAQFLTKESEDRGIKVVSAEA
ncbi:MAG: branched-chain amino acid transport system substrate-binding protein, partial [Patescibacteria group bacterium]|nr:branched-chain amino acid transport system substrate-binding protein [Patescibacteria group bacterium]